MSSLSLSLAASLGLPRGLWNHFPDLGFFIAAITVNADTWGWQRVSDSPLIPQGPTRPPTFFTSQKLPRIRRQKGARLVAAVGPPRAVPLSSAVCILQCAITAILSFSPHTKSLM